MKKGFSIQDYLEKNKIKLGTIKKEVGSTVYKGGHNDLRKTTYDVKIKDGKFQLDTHKTVLTENGKPINEDSKHASINEAGIVEKYNNIDKQKLLKLLLDEFKRGEIGKYDNTKLNITIEKYDKVKYDVIFKYDF